MEALSKLHGARWIGVPQEELHKKNGNILAYFRTKFRLKKPGSMEIAISGHSRYKLWVNGHRAAVGPCKGDRWRHFYEVIDIGKYLISGENILAVEVTYFPPSLYREKNRGGPMSVVSNVFGPWLILKGICSTEDGKILANVTTGTAEWMVSVDDAITWVGREPREFMPVGAFEKVDGAALPWGWKTDMELEGGWAPAIEGWYADGSAWGEFSPLPLVQRPIPLMFETKRDFTREMAVRKDDLEQFSFGREGKVAISSGARKAIELDAGELTTGYFSLKTFGGAGSRITIRYAESYSLPPVIQYPIKGLRDDCINFKLLGYEDVYCPSGNYDVYEPFWFRTFRFVRLEVEVGEEQLILFKPCYAETGYPLEVKSSITTDAAWTGQLWDISIRTLKRCMHETYEDCPYYEQLQYTFDARLEALFTYMVSGDARLALKALEDFHSTLTPEGILHARGPSDEPNIIPVFSLYWIFMLEDYYWQTGDLDTVRRYRTTVDKVLDWFDRKIGSFGLTEKYLYWEFLDWVEEWQDENNLINAVHPASCKGPTATNNLIYAAALKSGAWLMDKTGRSQVAGEYLQRAENILGNVKKHCWNAKTGMYKESPVTEDYTQHAQAWAVLSGLAGGEKAQGILRNALESRKAAVCTFPFSFFMFRAMEKAGLYDLSESLWEPWKKAVQSNLTTWPEDFMRQRSDCHGWSSLPLYEFTRCILGVQPAEPGWEKVMIRPLCLSFGHAAGKVVTNKGIVEVEWHKTPEGFKIRGYVPHGIHSTVILPDGSCFDYPAGGTFDIQS